MNIASTRNLYRNLSPETALQMRVGSLGTSLRGCPDFVKLAVATEVDMLASDTLILAGRNTFASPLNFTAATVSGAALAALGVAGAAVGEAVLGPSAGGFAGGFAAMLAVVTLSQQIDDKLTPKDLDLATIPVTLSAMGAAVGSLAGPGWAIAGGAVGVHLPGLLNVLLGRRVTRFSR
jgi:hypothetical protein